MSKKTIYLIIGLIVIIFGVITVKGFLILKTSPQSPSVVATTTTNIPDNLSISDELGG